MNGIGDTLWTKTYGTSSTEYGYSIQQTSDNGYIISGQVTLIKTNSSGDTLWTKRYLDGNEYGGTCIPTSDGGFLVYTTDNFFSALDDDMYLIKTNSTGNSGCYTFPYNYAIGKAPFTKGSYPVVVSSGGISLGISSSNIYVGTTPTVLCYDSTTTNITETEERNIFIYPNPFSTQTTLHTNEFLKNATLTIYNSFGQTVKQIKNISGQTVTLFRDNLPSGLYFVHLTQNNQVIATKKLIITD